MVVGMAAGAALLGCGRPAGEASAHQDTSAAKGATASQDAAADECRVVERSISLPEGLAEASGAAWSVTRPGAFWSHNDSGGDAELFLVGSNGRNEGRVRLRGARMDDWEDLAMAPCASGQCLYVADIGDNGRKKDEPINLLVLPEPAAGARTVEVATFSGGFPDGHGRDAEALFALPDGRIFMITKGNRDPIELYQWPTPLADGAALVRIRELEPEPEQTGDRVTGASASPDGRYVAVRSYARLSIFRTAELLDGRPAALTMDLTPLGEGQGEGVALANDGTVVLVSESGSRHVPGTAAMLRCTLP
jgi:hypothetical protein